MYEPHYLDERIDLSLVELDGAPSDCLARYEQQKQAVWDPTKEDTLINVYRFRWLKELNMHVPWNDRDPLKHKYYGSNYRIYSGHPEKCDLTIENSRYNNKKFSQIPTTPPPYLDFTC